MNNNQILGKIGENIACQILRSNNYNILERNFRCKQGEIDIIALDINSKELVFVEVKTRTSLKYGTPADAVNSNKQKHLYESAKYYIYKNNMSYIGVRLDVMEVYIFKEKIEVNHIKNAI